MDLRVALDTTRYTDLLRGDGALLRLLEEADEVLFPFPVVAELRAGFALGKKGAENELYFRRFLGRPGVAVLYADDGTLHHFAALTRQLRLQGTPMPANGVWIGALVLQHDLLLISRDPHFDLLPQIPRA